MLFQEGHLLPVALARVEEQLGGMDVVAELIAFIRSSKRGVSSMRERIREVAA
jgi:hypothetical protein